MPIVAIVAAVGLLVGGVGGYMVSEGQQSVDNTIKWALIGAGMALAAKKMKVIK